MPAERIFFTVTLGELAELPGTPFSYWAPPSLRALFHRYPPLDRDVARQPEKPKIADVKHGAKTNDDLRFTRCWWEVSVEAIAVSREETHQGKTWVPFAKGGRPFYHDIQMLINWENEGSEIKAYALEQYPYLKGKPNWAVGANESFYFRPGLTFPNVVSSVRINARVIPAGCIFTVKHQGIFAPSHNQDWTLCAFLNSLLAAFIHYSMNPLQHGRDTGELSRFPTNPLILENNLLHNLAREAHDLLREWATGEETATVFIAPWLLQVWHAVRSEPQSAAEWRPDNASPHPALHHEQGENEAEGCSAWESLQPVTGHPLARDFAWSDWESARAIRRAVLQAAGAGPGLLRSLAQACVLWERLLRARLDEIQRQIDDEVYRLYEISEEDRALIERELGKSMAEPEEAEEEETGEAGEEEGEPAAPGILSPEEHIRRLVHYLARQAVRASENGIVPLADGYTADGRLERGLAHRVREQLRALFGEQAMPAVERELSRALGKSLEDWLATDFFGYHVGLFRLRPVIWQVVPPSGRRRPTADLPFSVFLDWHRLDADTLRKVRYLYLQPHLDAARREVERTERDIVTAREAGDLSFRAERELERRLQEQRARRDALQALADKLEALLRPHALRVESRSEWVKAKVNEIIAEGYRPHRDYGVRVNIEPLKQAGILPPDAERIRG